MVSIHKKSFLRIEELEKQELIFQKENNELKNANALLKEEIEMLKITKPEKTDDLQKNNDIVFFD